MNIEPSISAAPPGEVLLTTAPEGDASAKSSALPLDLSPSGSALTGLAPTGLAPVIGVVAMMAVALPLVLGLQSHPCAANLARSDAASGPHHPTAIAWNTNFESARHIALTSHKTMMIAFYREGCAVCQQMEVAVYGRAAIIAAAQNIVPVKIDGEAQSQLASRYAIQKYPTIVWTDAAGAEQHRFEGAPSGYELYQAMEQNH